MLIDLCPVIACGPLSNYIDYHQFIFNIDQPWQGAESGTTLSNILMYHMALLHTFYIYACHVQEQLEYIL